MLDGIRRGGAACVCRVGSAWRGVYSCLIRNGWAKSKKKRFGGGLVLENDVEGVDDTGDVTQNCEEDVDAEIAAAALLEEDTKRREEDGEEDLADVASGECHCDGW